MKRLTLSIAATGVLALAAYSLADARVAHRAWGFHPAAFEQARGGPGGPGGGFGPGRRGGGPMGALRGVDLTDEQRAQIRAIYEEDRQGRQGPPADMKLHRQLQAELYADSPDAQRIAALQDQLLQAHSAAVTQQIALTQKVAQVLTPEQRAAVRERLAGEPPAGTGR